MNRPSRHIEPHGLLASARHYIRELIYGANDGIITTFAVVAGVSGGQLPERAILIVGAANLLADGVSMAVGNYQSIRAHEAVLEASDLPEEEAFPVRHAVMTFAAFVVAGVVPLLPYAAGGVSTLMFPMSLALTLLALFVVGASRALVSAVRWWKAGLDMLWLGVAVAALAYAAGAVGAHFVAGP
jgi:vacuolar iron transporter family protein